MLTKVLHVQGELGEMDNWQGDTNAWEDESDATWEAEEVLRSYHTFIRVSNCEYFALFSYAQNI